MRLRSAVRGWLRVQTAALALGASLLAFAGLAEPAAPRLRLVVETDAGGDPDDEQSLVRFLLYANEWEVVGIIANRARAREGENRNSERSGLGIVRRLVRAYGECWPRLREHDARYPAPAGLLERTVSGCADSEDGVALLQRALDIEDPRPLWFLNWGTDAGSDASTLVRTLERVRAERGEEGYARLKRKLRLSSDDRFGSHTFEMTPPFPLWVDTYRPPVEGRRWYHAFAALTARAGGFDLSRDVLNGHGPLGALYPTNTGPPQKEGDSMTFLYLVPTGMNDPEHPAWGSWAGRYGLRDGAGERAYYWAGVADEWHGRQHRDQTLARWAEALQNDFRARLDWCVHRPADANHPPIVRLDGQPAYAPVRLSPRIGEWVTVEATQSSDPDGDSLTMDWELYPEAGDFTSAITWGHQGAHARWRVPEEAAGHQVHLLLSVTDSGRPPLTRYARVVVEPRR